MDSLTQVVLGASMGEAVLGKKLGNKALLWGAIAGTIPDLDVLANPLLDVVGELSFHRSITHSLFFVVVFSPLSAWITQKIYPNSVVSQKQWITFFTLAYFTHILLDCFTTWGTQLFYPFSTYGVAFYSIFVVDPLYTVPFLIFLITLMFYPKEHFNRLLFNTLGLLFSTTYLLIAFENKNIANKVFEENLGRLEINYSSYISKPTAFNAILWAITVDAEDGYYTGYHSLFDEDHQLLFNFIPKNHELLEPYADHPRLKKLLKITKDYYSVEKVEDGFYIYDLRFGQFNGWQNGDNGQFVFTYHIIPQGDDIQFEQIDFKYKPSNEELSAFWDRIMGKGHEMDTR